ncbi:MAG: VRR-NUC domain-containing protein [Nanoarchaeota archaeon]|nr:VRR-NUC domain-containing protein [Nanoarchaeota archaeon]MBU0977553.1 VRR-NUC domain-containing protein [Nanoarchaeota archaeon]
MKNFKVEILRLRYPLRKSERMGRTVEGYVAQHYRKKGYSVLSSRKTDIWNGRREIDYGTFFRGYPDFITVEKSFIEEDLERWKRHLNENKNDKIKTNVWINEKQLTKKELKEKINERLKMISGTIDDPSVQKEINEKYKDIYEKLRVSHRNQVKQLTKISLDNGKPDLFVFNKREIFFCEVKSHNDSWSRNQAEWFIKNNNFPYVLLFIV